MEQLAAYWFILLGGMAVLALIPAYIAKGKGRSFNGFFIFGLVFWIVALIVALAISPRRGVSTGDLVKVDGKVNLSDGRRLPIGFKTKVLDVDVIQGEPAVEITGPEGETHWIPRSVVRPI